MTTMKNQECNNVLFDQTWELSNYISQSSGCRVEFMITQSKLVKHKNKTHSLIC